MASKKLKPQNELTGTSLGDKDLGLKMSPNTQGTKIAAVSGSNEMKPARKKFPSPSKDMTRSSPAHGYDGAAGWR